jgi:hypothetical protein
LAFNRGSQIGPGKILSLEQQRLASELCQSVGKAVAEIKPGWVPPFTELQPCAEGEPRKCGIAGNDFDVQAGNLFGELLVSVHAPPAGGDLGGFQPRRRRHAQLVGVMKSLGKVDGVRFFEQDGHQGRGVDHEGLGHQRGIPFSS